MSQTGRTIIGVIGSLQSEIRRHEKRAVELRQALTIVANGKNPLALAKAGFKRHVAATTADTAYVARPHWTQRMTAAERKAFGQKIARGWRRRLAQQKA